MLLPLFDKTSIRFKLGFHDPREESDLADFALPSATDLGW